MSTKGILSEQPQGIGSILGGSEFEKPNRTATAAATSLRRTLSADMSSKKWLLQHGFSPLKRIASSEELQSEPSSDDIWNSNQSKEEEEKMKNKINEQKYDMWSSILTEKPSSLPPPYVHPLVKRSKGSLTGKSLEICTENLGSDSGSDGFSSSEINSSSSSDDDDEQEQEVVVEEEEEEVEQEEEEEVKESETVEMAGNVHEKVNYTTTTCSVSSVSRKSSSSPPRSFPPPLPSLSRPGLHIRPRREDGRLVLQAITVPTQNYFHAQRQDGRLLLTFIKSPSQPLSMENDENEVEEIDEDENIEKVLSDDDEEVVFESEDEDEEEEAMVEKGGFEMEMEMELSQPPTKKLPTGVINVHRSAVMVNKFIGGLAINRNPNWSHKLEKMVQMEVEEEDANDSTLFPQSLPSPPPRKAMPRLIPTSPATTITSSFNTYEYCWRRKPSSVTGGGIMTKQSIPINNNNNNNITNNNNNNNNTINKNFLVSSRNSSKAYQEKQQQFVVKRGRGEKGDYLLAPLINSCKEPRRSLLSWEPYCIATS